MIQNVLDNNVDYQKVQRQFYRDVERGLMSSPKKLLCKYFYDARGATLFDRICSTEEYYPTQKEISILQNEIEKISSYIPNNSALIEYGSGAGIKTQLLLKHFKGLKYYVPIDVSLQQLMDYAQKLRGDFPHLDVCPLHEDFTGDYDLPQILHHLDRRVFFFPGSTIGNFDKAEAIKMLKNISDKCHEQDVLIIGVDLLKDESIMLRAYDDRQGITAEFNLNILKRINDELGANFDLNSFSHQARYNSFEQRIEMHLVSNKDQYVTIGSKEIAFSENESIHTESSHKYTIEGFTIMADQAGFEFCRHWTDSENYFAEILLQKKL